MVRQGTTLAQSPSNLNKIQQAHNVLAKVLAEGLQHGFHGEVAVKLIIQDGTIQQVRRHVNQKER